MKTNVLSHVLRWSILFPASLAVLVSCNLFNPPPAAPAAVPESSATGAITGVEAALPQGQSEFVSSQTATPTVQAALFLRGLTSSATITLNGKSNLSSGASLHGNLGFTLNGNVSISGTVTASSEATTCIDNAKLNACSNGKPKNLIPSITVPIPSYNDFLDSYKPTTFDKTLEGNQNINSAADLASKFPQGSTVWVKGNLSINSKLTLDGVTVFVERNLNLNGGMNLSKTVILAQQIEVNGSEGKLEDSVLIAAKGLNINNALDSSNQSTLFAAENLSLNGKISVPDTSFL